jgi:hypothetical protein
LPDIVVTGYRLLRERHGSELLFHRVEDEHLPLSSEHTTGVQSTAVRRNISPRELSCHPNLLSTYIAPYLML